MSDGIRQTPRDGRIAALAARQHGLVTLAQLGALGLSASGVRYRVTAGRLHRVRRGVYAVGHALLSVQGRRLAAVLACGPAAVLSHRPAANHLGLRPSASGRIEVTVPNESHRAPAGITVHRSTTLLSRDVTVVDAIPVTTPARTLLDLAGLVDRRGLERALDRASTLRILDADAIQDVLARASGRRGTTALRNALSTHAPGTTMTRSQFEERLLAFIDRAGLPRPEINAWIPWPEGGGAEADFLYRDRRLILEADHLATHGTRSAAERDRRRDLRLHNAGYLTLRVTPRQLTEQSAELEYAIRGTQP